jgi:hypothetical protein
MSSENNTDKSPKIRKIMGLTKHHLTDRISESGIIIGLKHMTTTDKIV